MTDNEIMLIEVGKYQNALSNLCGVEYPYMQGDPDVDAITELISIVVQQKKLINRQEAEIDGLIAAQDALERNLSSVIKAEAIKEFVARLKLYKIKPEFPWDDFFITECVVDDLAKQMVDELVSD